MTLKDFLDIIPIFAWTIAGALSIEENMQAAIPSFILAFMHVRCFVMEN